ncbi:hypothetical protein [Alteromonas sp. ASW11-130]|nr:hypothetical protein [Alteromonas sp. ASW11-130]MCW8092134.1 hypothetical protein [Alteromonas sp. ASW11-130]
MALALEFIALLEGDVDLLSSSNAFSVYVMIDVRRIVYGKHI